MEDRGPQSPKGGAVRIIYGTYLFDPGNIQEILFRANEHPFDQRLSSLLTESLTLLASISKNCFKPELICFLVARSIPFKNYDRLSVVTGHRREAEKAKQAKAFGLEKNSR